MPPVRGHMEKKLKAVAATVSSSSTYNMYLKLQNASYFKEESVLFFVKPF